MAASNARIATVRMSSMVLNPFTVSLRLCVSERPWSISSVLVSARLLRDLFKGYLLHAFGSNGSFGCMAKQIRCQGPETLRGFSSVGFSGHTLIGWIILLNCEFLPTCRPHIPGCAESRSFSFRAGIRLEISPKSIKSFYVPENYLTPDRCETCGICDLEADRHTKSLETGNGVEPDNFSRGKRNFFNGLWLIHRLWVSLCLP